MAAKDQIYVATDSGHAEVNGVPYVFHKGITRVRAGHPLTKIKGFENIFEPVDEAVHYDVESATAGPGEKRGAKGNGDKGRRSQAAAAAAAVVPESSGEE